MTVKTEGWIQHGKEHSNHQGQQEEVRREAYPPKGEEIPSSHLSSRTDGEGGTDKEV